MTIFITSHMKRTDRSNESKSTFSVSGRKGVAMIGQTPVKSGRFVDMQRTPRREANWCVMKRPIIVCTSECTTKMHKTVVGTSECTKLWNSINVFFRWCAGSAYLGLVHLNAP